jgi:hypothetical protein
MPAFFLSIVLFATLLPSFLTPALLGPAPQRHRMPGCQCFSGFLFGFPMRRLCPAASAELAQFQPILGILFIFLCRVIALLAHGAGERNHNPVFFPFGCHKKPL